MMNGMTDSERIAELGKVTGYDRAVCGIDDSLDRISVVSVGLGARRCRFAWLPVRLWEDYYDERGNYWVRPTVKCAWLKQVTEKHTLRGWTAYTHDQLGHA